MKKKWIAPILLAGILFLGVNETEVKQLYAKTDDTHIYQGISIEGIDVSGDTKEEAQKKVDSYIKTLQNKEVTFETKLGTTTKSMKDLGLTYTNKEVVQQAYSYGKVGNIIRRYKEQKDAQQDSVKFVLNKNIDTKKAKEQIQQSEDNLIQHAKNATLTRQNGTFQIIKEEEGTVIDYDQSMKQLKQYVSNEWNKKDATFALKTVVEEPKYKSEDLSEVKDVLGTFTTNYSSSTEDRAQNVSNATAHINGTVVYPGEEFSTYDKIAPYTYENGYRTGKAYSNGEVIDSIGGGVCQVSTTLYNALIRSELEITERMPHSMTVNYVPLAADAAMAGTYKNLKFKNNTDTPIYVEGSTYNRNVTFIIYGKETRPDNRTLEFRSETVATYQPNSVTTSDATMLEGKKVVTRYGHTGYQAKLWKDVYVDGKKEDSILVNTSTYQAVPTLITVGTKKEEPKKEEPKEENPEEEKTTQSDTTEKDSSEKLEKKENSEQQKEQSGVTMEVTPANPGDE